LAVQVADAAIVPAAAFAARAALGAGDHARLKELVGGQAEEVRDAVEVLQLNFARAVEELVDPGLIFLKPTRQVHLVLFARVQQPADVRADDVERV